MTKLIVLLLLVLTIPTLQQVVIPAETTAETSSDSQGIEIGEASEEIVAKSGIQAVQEDGSTPIIGAKIGNQFAPPQTAPALSSLSSSQQYNWDFLNTPNSYIQGSPRWVLGTTNRNLWGPYRSFSFKTRFCSYCPQNGITLYLSNTCYVYIRINGQWLGFYNPNWFGSYTIYIPDSMLLCGCDNKIEFFGYSYSHYYPIAISYRFSQNCFNAMNCPYRWQSYNLKTCRC